MPGGEASIQKSSSGPSSPPQVLPQVSSSGAISSLNAARNLLLEPPPHADPEEFSLKEGRHPADPGTSSRRSSGLEGGYLVCPEAG